MNNLKKDTSPDTLFDEFVTVQRVDSERSLQTKKLKLSPVDKYFADILERSLLYRRKGGAAG